MKRFMQVLMVLVVGCLAGNAAIAGLVVDLQAVNFDPTTQMWTNTADDTRDFKGELGKAWAPTKGVVAGATAVLFDGIGGLYNGTRVYQKLESEQAAPDSVRGTNGWSAEMWVYNDVVGTREDCFQWARPSAGASKGAVLGYGSNTTDGAYSHNSNDAGYTGGAPEAAKWHYIVLTYSGGTDGTENLYVDGVLNRTDTRTLNLSTESFPMMIGTGFQDWFINGASVAIGAVRLRTEVLNVDAIHTTYVTEGVTYGVVPEPSSIVILVGAFLGLIAYA